MSAAAVMDSLDYQRLRAWDWYARSAHSPRDNFGPSRGTGRFPKPVKFGSHVTAWRVEDIRKLIESA